MDEQKNNNGMNNETKKNVCSCGCGAYSYGWHNGRLFRILIATIIALAIFWIGVHVGEAHSRYGGFMMRRGYPMVRGFGGVPRMMPGGVGGGVPVPVSGTATTTVQ